MIGNAVDYVKTMLVNIFTSEKTIVLNDMILQANKTQDSVIVQMKSIENLKVNLSSLKDIRGKNFEETFCKTLNEFGVRGQTYEEVLDDLYKILEKMSKVLTSIIKILHKKP